MIRAKMPTDEDQTEAEGDTDKRLSMVDEALVAGTIANTNGLLVILAKLVARGVFDRADLQSFSDFIRSRSITSACARMSSSVRCRIRWNSTLAELMRFLSERDCDD